MTTFEKIVNALSGFDIPCSPGVYKGSEKRWITYNYADDYGDVFADDDPYVVINSVQIHLFLPLNEAFTEWKKSIRRALFDAGFTFAEITVQIEDDEKIRHIIFECDIEEEGE